VRSLDVKTLWYAAQLDVARAIVAKRSGVLGSNWQKWQQSPHFLREFGDLLVYHAFLGRHQLQAMVL